MNPQMAGMVQQIRETLQTEKLRDMTSKPRKAPAHDVHGSMFRGVGMGVRRSTPFPDLRNANSPLRRHQVMQRELPALNSVGTFSEGAEGNPFRGVESVDAAAYGRRWFGEFGLPKFSARFGAPGVGGFGAQAAAADTRLAERMSEMHYRKWG